jgi:hypothetical protein
MFRWQEVEDQTIFDMTVKMYRDPFVAEETFKAYETRRELDHHAFKYLGSETDFYKILDTNFVVFMEARGNVDELGKIDVPRIQDTESTIY